MGNHFPLPAPDAMGPQVRHLTKASPPHVRCCQRPAAALSLGSRKRHTTTVCRPAQKGIACEFSLHSEETP